MALGRLMIRPTCSISNGLHQRSINSFMLKTSWRSASGYHTFDVNNLSGENIYSQFQKKSIAIGELIGFVNHLKVLYANSNPGMKR